MNSAPAETRYTISVMIGALCILAAFGLSLFFNGYRDIIYAPASMLLLTGACLAIIPSFWRSFYVSSAITALLVFLFWLYVTISLAWSTVPFSSLVTYIVFFSGPLMFFTMVMAYNGAAWLRLTITLLLVALAILGGWATIQYFFLADIYGTRAHHPLDNPNILAALLNLGLLPLLALALTTPLKSRAGSITVILCLLVFSGLIATESRAGFFNFLIAGTLLAFTLLPDIRKNISGISILVAVGLALFVLSSFHSETAITDRMSFLVNPTADDTLAPRFGLWAAAFHMLRDHLWTGTGLGTFYLYYSSYRLPIDTNSAGSWAHIDPVQFGLETGITATIVFYLAAFAVLGRTIAALRIAPHGARERTLIAGFSGGLLTVFFHAHLSFPLYTMPVLVICGLWLAAWYLLTSDVLGKAPGWKISVEGSQRPVLIGSAFMIAVLIGYLGFSSAWGQFHVSRATDAIQKGNVEAFTGHIEQAERFAPASFIDPEVQLAGLYIDLLGSADALFSREDQAKMVQDTASLLDNAQSMNPAWAEIDYKRGLLYSTEDEDAQAMKAWQAALAKDPAHYKARQALAEAQLANGWPARAFDLIEQGLRYPHSQKTHEQYQSALNRLEPLATMQKAHKIKENHEITPEDKQAP